ncbi:MAG TPA: DUF2478 domain-containing protein [Burkholderiaceae bacterium]|nr:DUF2478 domain-containing protein [Burkholderiaceae bacterium]
MTGGVLRMPVAVPDDGEDELCEPRAASIIDDGSGRAARLLSDVVRGLREAGCRVRGLVMTRPCGGADCASEMVLVDVETRDEYPVSQSLGPHSQACRADPHGFARASVALRHALHDDPALLVVNRFGMLEAEGQGFRAEFLEILSHDVPLLTVVAARHVDAWQQFTGAATVLPADAQAVREWLARTVSGACALTALGDE